MWVFVLFLCVEGLIKCMTEETTVYSTNPSSFHYVKYMYLLLCSVCLPPSNVISWTHQVYRDFSLICQNENIRDNFEDVFPQWARTTVTYCKETQLKSTAIQGEVSELESDLDDGEYCRFTVVCCLQYWASSVLFEFLFLLTCMAMTIYGVYRILSSS